MLLSLSRNELFQTQFWNQNIVTTVYRTGARVESKKELESEPKWARIRNTIEICLVFAMLIYATVFVK